MTKAKRYDTVVLLESIGKFQKGEKGAVAEVYTIPYEAYDIEIVTDEGKTIGLAEGGLSGADRGGSHGAFCLHSRRGRGDTGCSAIFRRNEVIVSAEELYAQSGR